MKDERQTVPRGRATWIGVLVTGVAVIGLALFGRDRLPTRQVPTPEPTVRATALPTPTAPATAAPLPTPLDTPRDDTFVSRELIATTRAVPIPDWTDDPGQAVALAADGNTLAFTTVTADGDNALYRYDLRNETLTPLVTDGWVGAPAISADGAVIAFYAWANDLVPNDTNAVQDAFVYDQATGTITRVSVGPNGIQANGRSGDPRGVAHPALSGDGRFVAFSSEASNLVPGDGNRTADVFLRDRATGEMFRISQAAGGVDADGASTDPALSLDGNLIAYRSTATNLDPTIPALPAAGQIYLYDRVAGTTTLISRGPDGRPGDGDSRFPALSGDGRDLVYSSAATNLIVGDTNGVDDIFLYDRATGETRRVSVASSGTQANRDSTWPTISLRRAARRVRLRGDQSGRRRRQRGRRPLCP